MLGQADSLHAPASGRGRQYTEILCMGRRAGVIASTPKHTLWADNHRQVSAHGDPVRGRPRDLAGERTLLMGACGLPTTPAISARRSCAWSDASSSPNHPDTFPYGEAALDPRSPAFWGLWQHCGNRDAVGFGGGYILYGGLDIWWDKSRCRTRRTAMSEFHLFRILKVCCGFGPSSNQIFKLYLYGTGTQNLRK